MVKKIFLLVCVLLASLYVQAQEQCGYAVFDSSSSTLTFKYGTPPSGDNVYLTDNTEYGPGWNGILINKVVFDKSFASARPTFTANWFCCYTLEEIIDIQYLNTSCVTDMSYMFENSYGLINLDVSHFDTSNVTSMDGMFRSCENLANLDVSHFNTSNVTRMWGMFAGCEKLTELDVSHFDTNSVTSMGEMFYRCRSLTSLDVSHFDTSNVTDMSDMFSCCSVLTNLDVSNFNTSNVTNMKDMFSSCGELISLDVSRFCTSNVTNMQGMFGDCKKLADLDVTNFDTRNVTNMSEMFGWCYALTYLDVTHFDTSSVMYMENMFGESGLKNIDVSNFNTSKVKNMRGMFHTIENLKNLDVSNFDTSNVTDMSYMFSGLYCLTSLDVTNFNTRKVTNMSDMFLGCSALTSLDITNFETSNVTNMSNMFYGCYNLKELDISNFETGNVTDMSNMFHDCARLVTIYASDLWSTKSVTSGYKMFSECYYLIGGEGTYCNNADYTYARIDGGANMPGAFTYKAAEYKPQKGCGYAVFDSETSILTFKYGEKPVGENVFDTDDTQFDDLPWNGCRSKKVIFDSSFAEARPKSTARWFYYRDWCPLTEIVGLQYLNTSDVTDMSYMFFGCSLTSIDVSNFDTSNVTDMTNMFCFCWDIISLDISNFDTSNVTDMSGLFYYCSSLSTIYVGDLWSTKSLVDYGGYGMFNDCEKLKGGKGTKYSSDHTDYTYARIDGGASAPGYFTLVGTEVIIKGDANGDGIVDQKDIEFVSGFIMTGVEPEGFVWSNADVNGDNKINAADIVQIVNIMKAAAQQ